MSSYQNACVVLSRYPKTKMLAFFTLPANPLAAHNSAKYRAAFGDQRQNGRTKECHLQTARWPAEYLPDQGHQSLEMLPATCQAHRERIQIGVDCRIPLLDANAAIKQVCWAIMGENASFFYCRYCLQEERTSAFIACCSRTLHHV